MVEMLIVPLSIITSSSFNSSLATSPSVVHDLLCDNWGWACELVAALSAEIKDGLFVDRRCLLVSESNRFCVLVGMVDLLFGSWGESSYLCTFSCRN